MANDFKSLGKVLEEVLQRYKLNSKMNEVNLVNSWEQIVGPLIARKTDKIQLKEKTLIVYVNSAPLKQELNFSKDQIIQMIGEKFGKGYVTELVVR